MKMLSCAICCLCLLFTSAHADTWRFPGEFEPQSAVWVGWLSKEYIKGYPTDKVMTEIVFNLAAPWRDTDVVVCVPDENTKNHVDALLRKKPLDMKRIRYYVTPFTVPYWRDYGPIFLKNDQGGLKIADFGFSMWGYYPQSDRQSRVHERIDRQIARTPGIVSGIGSVKGSEMTRVVSEGGDRLFNGKGTMIAVEACEFQRNPNMSREELEAEYRRVLGVKKIIWLKQGTVEDDRYDTTTLPGPKGKGIAYRSAAANNHADEFCRFIDAGTILLAEVTQKEATNPVAIENRRRMEENWDILNASTDQDGNHFEIKRIPMPETLYFDANPGDEVYASLLSSAKYVDGTAFPLGKPVKVVPAMSYCNFLISNKVVLAQQYYVENKGMSEDVRKKDDRAVAVLKDLFPGREIITINTTALNFGGGGIHCATQQQPLP